MSKVFIIILNWNRKEDTLACLESLIRINIAEHSVSLVVVDNASTDDSAKVLKKELKSLTFKKKKLNGVLIKNKENLGFTGGNNTGIRLAYNSKADYVVLLNNDTLVDENFLVEIVKYANENNSVGLISPKIYFAPGFEFHKDRYSVKDKGKVIWYMGGKMDWNNIYGTNEGVDEVDQGQFESPHTTDFATGACMLISKSVIEKVGYLDDSYFMYLEDVDLSERVRRAGYEVRVVPQSKVWHKVAQSSGVGSSLNDYFIHRNRLLFGFKYASFRTKLALIRESARLIFKGRKWQKRGITDFYLSRLGMGSWGK